ncbi:MAG: hypothetical protein O2780_16330 [Proteobacteria bacterium]|nr:hypothetical protein [Pseudomonadota bacterium]MDA1300003.1 hypothetical protein [Pseudomonadota bacterium]
MRIPAIVIILFLAAGCSTAPIPADAMIQGTWRGDIGGVPVIYEYTDNMVRVVGYDAVPYRIDDGRLTVMVQGSTERIVAFPSRDEMVQTDPVTGTQLRLMRVN